MTEKQMKSVRQVYALVAHRSLENSWEAYRVAKRVLPVTEGACRLALLEAIADTLSNFLTELAENGRQNQELWGIKLENVDVAGWVAECEEVLQEIKQLRSAGISSSELIKPYVNDWVFPIGSRDWFYQRRQGLAHMQEEDWISRVAQSLNAFAE